MAFKIDLYAPANQELARVIREELTESLVNTTEGKSLAERVHSIRRSLKRIRASLRLFRASLPVKTYRKENRWYRDTGRLLSRYRDGEILQLTAAKWGESQPEANLWLEKLRAEQATELEIEKVLKEVRQRLLLGQARCGKWKFLEAAGFAPGFLKTYRRAERCGREAEAKPSALKFHVWRKRVKYHGFHLKLLRDMEFAVRRLEAVEALGKLLGTAHDLAVLEEWAKANGVEKASRQSLRARRRQLEQEALEAGIPLFAHGIQVLSEGLNLTS